MKDPFDYPLAGDPLRMDAYRAARRRADDRRLWLDFIALLVLLSAVLAAWLRVEGWIG